MHNAVQTSYIPYLTLNDYLSTIQGGQLSNQLLDAVEFGGNSQRMFAESWAIGQVRSYLGDYFDLDFELTQTRPFSYRKRYHAGDRIIIDFSEWQASINSEDESAIGRIVYNIGDCIIVFSNKEDKLGGIGYMCKVQNSDTIFNQDNWTQIGNQYDIYYIKYPHVQFFLTVEEANGTFVRGFYNVGDKICYKNHTYECLIKTVLYSHPFVEQFYSTNAVPPQNYFPDSQNNPQWKDLGEYYFVSEPPFYPIEECYDRNIGIGGEISSVGQDGDGNPEIVPDVVESINGSVWELGDNRDPLVIQALIDLCIWRLHSRISPDNIPELRENNKNTIFQWLRDVQKGIQAINVPKIQPRQVGDISWGSNVKKINGY